MIATQMPDVDTSREVVERLANDLQNVRWAADQGCKMREDAAHTLRALLAEVEALRKERDEVGMALQYGHDAINAVRAERDAALARATAAEGERDRMREALREVRAAVTNENGRNGFAIIDTVWVSAIETAVDRIDAALASKEPTT